MKKLVYILIADCLLLFNTYTQPSVTWQRLYNGPEQKEDLGFSVCPVNNNCYIIAGSTWNSIPQYRLLYLIKINVQGDTIWARTISLNEEHGGGSIRAVTPSMDGGCVITGDAYSSFAIKLDSNGAIIWQKYYGGASEVICRDLTGFWDGGFVACGRANYWSAYVIKFGSNGDSLWQYLNNSGYNTDFYSIEESPGGGYAAGGNIFNLVDTSKALVVKFSSNGNIVWEKTYVVLRGNANVRSLKKLTNGYIISGMCQDTNNPNIWKNFFMKIDLNGNYISSKLISSNRTEYFTSMSVVNDNSYVFSLEHQKENVDDTFYTRILITDSLANILSQKVIRSLDYVEFKSILPVSNGDILFVGDANFSQSSFWNDIYAVRSDRNMNFPPNIIGVKSTDAAIPKSFYLYQNYPNPFNPSTRIKFSIPAVGQRHAFDVRMVVYDVLGREIAVLVNQELKPGTYEVEWDASYFASGIYFYRLIAGEFTDTKSMVLIK